MDKEEIKNKIFQSQTFLFFNQKKVQNILLIVLLLSLLIFSSWVRVQNLPLLIDQTTNEYIPLALDPFYFLRVAETINDGGLPIYDSMRYPSLNVGFSQEILPQTVVLLYKFINIFDKEVTLQYIFVISPVIFFILGLIVFFFLILVLTNSKSIALLSSIFLAIIPTYLYRTMAGFADHEAIGMFAFFLTLLCYSFSLKYLEKESLKLKYFVFFGLLVGFFSAFTIASWGGIANFIFMIIPLSFGLFWLIKSKNPDEKFLFNFLIFYLIWFISSIFFSLLYGFDLSFILGKVTLTTSSLINGVLLLFLIADFCIIKFGKQLLESKRKFKKYRVIYSTFLTMIVGGILLSLYGTNVFSLIPNLFTQLLHPFGAQRTGLTVAENLQPYLMDWINQMGNIFFWIFYLGMIFVGIEFSKGINTKKNKIFFSLSWIILISGVLFSRISSVSVLNGVNFISSLVYFGSLFLFLGYCVWLYFNDEIKVKNGILIISSWIFFILIAGRGATRLLFVITPLVCFMASYSVIKLFEYLKKSKEEVLRMAMIISLILVILGLGMSSFNFVTSIVQQSKYTGPSANYQWQNSMSWVRDNTPEGSIFVHWWDYGYWVEYLGQRPSVTDGGHANGFWDHLIGRYLLTTTNPETALSFMKTQNVSYLLIDYTDLGKYPAYSKIGSGELGEDRFAGIPLFQSDRKQISETSTGMTFVYVGGSYVDEDIIYEKEDTQILLPSQRAMIIGIFVEANTLAENSSINQPIGVFLYKDIQYQIPLRYIYLNKELIDFKNGVDAVVSFIPQVSQESQSLQIDSLGTLIYLSPKVSKSLFAQLYLLDDAFKNYPTLKVVHSEPDMVVSDLNMQGANVGELIYYQGFRGPIKIWEVDYPENIIEREEFLRKEGKYAEFDNLKFVK